jgi:pyrroloquinoline quinone biosynthesis protein B
MEMILLGTAAGGGFPQWNCWCPTCRVARSDSARAHPRTQSSIAVSSDGVRWFLINASPDVREQMARVRRPAPASGVVRDVSIEGVVLTDAELDHTIGLLLLREARDLTVYATNAVTAVLDRDSRILPTLRAFARVQVVPLTLDRAIPMRDRHGTEVGLTVEAFAVGGDAPRFASADTAGAEVAGSTVGLTIRDARGGTAVCVPGCAAIDESLVDRLRSAGAVLFDGTFWSDDELTALGISALSARAMGHIPIAGAGGSLSILAELPAPTRVYTHINNTNPILIEDSPERRAVLREGVTVGMDGMTFIVTTTP